MKITVTQKHIDNGQRARTASCPIALTIHEKKPNHKVSVDYKSVMTLAVREKFPKAKRIVVSSEDIYVEKWFLSYGGVLPMDLHRVVYKSTIKLGQYLNNVSILSIL